MLKKCYPIKTPTKEALIHSLSIQKKSKNEYNGLFADRAFIKQDEPTPLNNNNIRYHNLMTTLWQRLVKI